MLAEHEVARQNERRVPSTRSIRPRRRSRITRRIYTHGEDRTIPAGGRLFRPTRPPRLTTRPGEPRTTCYRVATGSVTNAAHRSIRPRAGRTVAPVRCAQSLPGTADVRVIRGRRPSPIRKRGDLDAQRADRVDDAFLSMLEHVWPGVALGIRVDGHLSRVDDLDRAHHLPFGLSGCSRTWSVAASCHSVWPMLRRSTILWICRRLQFGLDLEPFEAVIDLRPQLGDAGLELVRR